MVVPLLSQPQVFHVQPSVSEQTRLKPTDHPECVQLRSMSALKRFTSRSITPQMGLASWLWPETGLLDWPETWLDSAPPDMAAAIWSPPMPLTVLIISDEGRRETSTHALAPLALRARTET